MEGLRAIELINDSLAIASKSKNIDIKVSRWMLSLDRARFLYQYENKGIDTTFPPPSEVLMSLPNDIDNAIHIAWNAEAEKFHADPTAGKRKEAKRQKIIKTFEPLVKNITGSEIKTGIQNGLTILKSTALSDFSVQGKQKAPSIRKKHKEAELEDPVSADQAIHIKRHGEALAYSKRRFAEMMEIAEDRPYWMFICIGDVASNPEHKALNGQIYRYDDPFWKTNYPPLELGCRCRVRALTVSQVAERQPSPYSPPDITPAKSTFKDNQTCPNCHLENPWSAWVCDCGYSFSTGSYSQVKTGEKATKSTAVSFALPITVMIGLLVLIGALVGNCAK